MEDDLVAVAARRGQPQPRFGVCWPHNGDYRDPGRISLIKRASAARRVATSQGSRPGSIRLFFPTLRALGGQVPPGQLTSSAANVRGAPPPAASRANFLLML